MHMIEPAPTPDEPRAVEIEALIGMRLKDFTGALYHVGPGDRIRVAEHDANALCAGYMPRARRVTPTEAPKSAAKR